MYISGALLFGQYFDGEVKSGDGNRASRFLRSKVRSMHRNSFLISVRCLVQGPHSYLRIFVNIARWAVPVHLHSHTTNIWPNFSFSIVRVGQFATLVCVHILIHNPNVQIGEIRH